MKTSIKNIQPYQTKDGSLVHELMHPDIHGNRKMSFALATIEAGISTVLHKHHASEEIYHFVQGKGLMRLGNDHIYVEAGDTVCIRPGVLHSVVNTGFDLLKIFCCCAPPYSHSDTEILQEIG